MGENGMRDGILHSSKISPPQNTIPYEEGKKLLHGSKTRQIPWLSRDQI